MRKLAIVLALSFAPALLGQNGVLVTVAGNGTTGTSGVGGPPVNAALVGGAICVDRFDNIYIADPSNNRVVKISNGMLTLLAGNGVAASTGDYGPAVLASLNNPTGVAVDFTGDVFIAEGNGNRVRVINPSTGIIYPVAGTGVAGYAGDGGPALNASLNRPMGIAVDAASNLYIADALNMRIRMVDQATRTIVTIVGTGVNGHSPDGTAAAAANLAMPYAVNFDRQGNMLISELLAYSIRRLSVTTGLLSTVAGNGQSTFNGDGQSATNAALGFTGSNVASDAAGNLYFGDGTGRVRRVDAATGIITTVAGSGAGAHSQSSSGGGGGGTSSCPSGLGENGPATLATLDSPASVAIMSSGALLISDPMDCHLFGVLLPSPLLYTNASLNLTGQSLNVTVTPIGGAATPTGTVQFVEYAAFGPPLPLASAPLSAGTATLDLSSLTAGSHQVMAIYMGDGAYNGSGSAVLGVTGGGRTTPSIGTNLPYPILVSTPVTITFNLAGSSGQPTGTAQVSEGATLLTSVTLMNGAGAFSYVASTAGTHQIILQYSGDTAYTPLSWAFPVSVLVPSALSLTADTNPAIPGATVTFIASLSPPNGSGRIAFFDNGATIASAQIVNGIATLPLSTLAAGTHSITASYNGDFTVAPSTSNVYTETINPMPTTLTLNTSGSPSTFGQSVALDAIITPAAATGMLVFYNGATQLGSAPLSNGAAHLTTTLLPAGAQTLTAVYNGSAGYAFSTSPVLIQAVNKATPVITVTASANPVLVPESVTLTATMTPAWDGSSLQIMDGGTLLAGATTPTGTFSLTRALPPGVHTITAVNPDDTNLNSATSGALTLTVQFNTGLFVSAPFGSTMFGQPVTFTASTALGATGTVQFSDGATAMGSAPIVNGVATLTAPALTAGSHSIQASYSGDGVYLPKTSGVWVQTVTKAFTTIALASSLNPAAAGQPVVFTATFLPATITGTVQFLDGATVIGTATIGGGVASVTPLGLAVGNHSITASYLGDANYNPDTSAALIQTVAKVSTAITASAGSPSISFGQSVTLTASVVPASATGTLQFLDGATVLGAVALNGGVATMAAANLAVGAHAITAVYAGDSTHTGTTSAAISVTVTKASTVAAVSASSGNIAFGQSVTLTVSLMPTSATGSVQFIDGAAVLGTGSVSGGAATLVTANLAVGTHAIRAVYGGDASYTGSNSAAVSVSVSKAGASLTLVPSRNPSVAGRTVSFTAAVTPTSATGSVQFLDGATVLGTVPLSGGTASLSTSGLAAGSHAITAVYRGNANYNGATSGILTQLVLAATTISISSNKSKAAEGQTVKFTANVAPSAATGTVQFLDGPTVIGSVPLSGGWAVLSIQNLAVGTHLVTASYLGSSGYAASVSGMVSLTIR